MDETTKKAVSTMVHLFNAIDDKIDTITAELHNKIDGVYLRLDETENVISIIKSEVERQRKVENKPRLLRKRAVEYKFDKESSSSDGSLFYPIMNVTGSTLTEFNAHQEVLVENHELLMSNLDLSVTNVLDEMVTNDAISNSDAEFVRSQPKIKDKTRQLLLLIACYGSSCFNKFIECLKKEYPFLFDKLNKEFGDLLSKTHGCNICILCKIKCAVDQNDIVDSLYKNKIIGARHLQSVFRCRNVKQAWNQIIHHVNKAEEGKQRFCEALEAKYKNLATELNKCETQNLSCTCIDGHQTEVLTHALPSQRSSVVSDIDSTTTSISLEDITLLTQLHENTNEENGSERGQSDTLQSKCVGNYDNEIGQHKKLQNVIGMFMESIVKYQKDNLDREPHDVNISQTGHKMSLSERRMDLNQFKTQGDVNGHQRSRSLPNSSTDIANTIQPRNTKTFIENSNSSFNLGILPRNHPFRKAFRSNRKRDYNSTCRSVLPFKSIN